jgi:hypothetical protein
MVRELVQAIANGKPIRGYWVSKVDGSIWSSKGKFLSRLSTSPKRNTGYIHLTFMCEQIGKIYLLHHRVVAETLIPFPAPEGVTLAEWNRTPKSVKSVVVSQFVVNHIDHDKTNNHPSNLEWVTSKQNAIKREEYYRKVK